MTIKNYLAIAIATVALTATLTSTGFAQWHPEIDKVKTRRPQTQSIQSPRDVASGQATGKRQHKPITKRPGFMDYTDDSTVNGVVAGQNSGGTITNQRRQRPSGITADDYWEQKRRTARKRK
jgi:hypothetical protein